MAFALTGKLSLDARDFVAGTDKAATSVGEIGDAFGEIPKDAKKATDGAGKELGKLPDEGGKVGKLTGGKLGGMMASGFAAVGVGALIMKGVNDALADQATERKMQGMFKATADEAEQWGNVAGDLYGDGWGQSMEDVSLTVGTAVRKLGLDTDEEIGNISRGVTAVADTWGKDFNEVIRSTGQLMQNDLAPNAEAALNLVVGGLQSGADEAGDMLDTIDEYAQHWSAAGLSGEEAMNQMVAGIELGLRDTDKIGDAVKEMRIRIVEDSEQVRAALEDIGLNADDVVEAFLEGGPAAKSAFMEVIEALEDGQEAGDDTANAVAIIGTQFEDMGPKALTALGTIEGALEDVETRLEGLVEDVEPGGIERFKRTTERGFADAAEAGANKYNQVLERFNYNDLAEEWYSKTRAEVEAATGFLNDFDMSLLDNVSTFTEARAVAAEHAEVLGDNAAAFDAANRIALEWNDTQKEQEMALKGTGTQLLDVNELLESGSDAADDNADSTDDAADAMDGASQESRDLARALAEAESAWDTLTGEMSDRKAFLELGDTFVDLESKLADIQTAYDEGAISAEEAARQTELAYIDAKEDVAEYVRDIGKIPADVQTRINALIDQGEFARVEGMLATLERTRYTTVIVSARDRAGNTVSGTFTDANGNTVGFAARGGLQDGGLTVVGEEGPELVEMPAGAFVYTAQQTASMVSTPIGVSSIVNNTRTSSTAAPVHVTVNAGIGTDGLKVGRQIESVLARYARQGAA